MDIQTWIKDKEAIVGLHLQYMYFFHDVKSDVVDSEMTLVVWEMMKVHCHIAIHSFINFFQENEHVLNIRRH